MARADIRGKDQEVFTDNGALNYGTVQGEQLHVPFTFDWISDFTGYTITAAVIEGDNVAGDADVVPTGEASSPTAVSLPIIDATVTDNAFIVVFTKDFSDAWSVQPTPDDPVYGFFSLQIADPQTGNDQQIFVIPRGTVEVRYNPVRSI